MESAAETSGDFPLDEINIDNFDFINNCTSLPLESYLIDNNMSASVSSSSSSSSSSPFSYDTNSVVAASTSNAATINNNNPYSYGNNNYYDPNASPFYQDYTYANVDVHGHGECGYPQSSLVTSTSTTSPASPANEQGWVNYAESEVNSTSDSGSDANSTTATKSVPEKRAYHRTSSNEKPPEPYAEIIAKAILSSSDNQMQLKDIYQYMIDK
jgi:hypothetical protein